MANINTLLQRILDAVYGEEVRGSIHDALSAINQESSNAEAVAISSRDSAKHHADRAEAALSGSVTAQDKAEDAQIGAETAEAGAIDAKDEVEQKLADLGYPISPRGPINFAQLPNTDTIGYMYQINDEFTTDSRFVEGAGIHCNEFTEVYFTAQNKWAIMQGAGVTGVKGDAEQNYRKGQVNITKSMIGINSLDDISTPTFTQASTRTNIDNGEAISVILGKIKKFFADLKTVAFTGNASDVDYDNTASGLTSTDVQDAIDEVNNAKITLVTFSDLSDYDIATSEEKINATLEEICKKVPNYCEVKVNWTGSDVTRFGTLANQIPTSYGSLYIHKNGNANPCVIEFIPYNSGIRYSRNFDYINSTDHLSDWINITNPSYIGQIIESTTLDTLAKVQAIYGTNTTWIQHQGYMLRGALRLVTPNNAVKDGGSDSNTHTHTLSHTHGLSAGFAKIIATNFGNKLSVGFATKTVSKYSGTTYVTNYSGASSTSSTTEAATALGGSTDGASTTTTSSPSDTNNLPPYKNVYIWERIHRRIEMNFHLTHLIEPFITIVIAVFSSSGFWLLVQRRYERKDNKTRMILGLAHDRLIFLGMEYIARGWLTDDEYENYRKYLYEPYHDLGGNGTGDKVMSQVDQLKLYRNYMDAEKAGEDTKSI